MKVKHTAGYDDSLDAFGVHGIGGLWGCLATGLFASTAVNESGADGLFHGNAGLFLVQAVNAVSCVVYSGAMTFLLYKITDRLVGLRVTREEEIMGLDLTQHKEQAYTVTE
jgi:Amt family ammonium transporter